MSEKYNKCFADSEGQKLEFWLSQNEKGLEKEQSQTEEEIENLEREIESLQEQKEQREAEELEEEQIAMLEHNKAEAILKLSLIKTNLTELKEGKK